MHCLRSIASAQLSTAAGSLLSAAATTNGLSPSAGNSWWRRGTSWIHPFTSRCARTPTRSLNPGVPTSRPDDSGQGAPIRAATSYAERFVRWTRPDPHPSPPETANSVSRSDVQQCVGGGCRAWPPAVRPLFLPLVCSAATLGCRSPRTGTAQLRARQARGRSARTDPARSDRTGHTGPAAHKVSRRPA